MWPSTVLHLQHDNDNYNPIFANNHFMVNRFHVFQGVVFSKVYQNSFKVNGNNMDGWLGFLHILSMQTAVILCLKLFKMLMSISERLHVSV